MGFVDTHQDYKPVGENERLDDEQKALERKAVRRIQKGNLQAMHKMFRVLMVQTLLEGATASSAQGLESPGAELPTCGNSQEPEAVSKPFWTMLLMALITAVAFGVLLIRSIYRRMRENQAAIQDMEIIISATRDGAMVQATRLDRLETGVALMRDRTSVAEGNLQRLRSEINALRAAIQRLERENPGPVMVVQTDVPGLRESIIRQAQERGIELSVHEGSEEEIHEPSDRGSDWYPGMEEDEAFGDNAQWMDEYRHIQEYEREHGPLVIPSSSRAVAPLTEGTEATENQREHQPEEEPMRAGHIG